MFKKGEFFSQKAENTHEKALLSRFLGKKFSLFKHFGFAKEEALATQTFSPLRPCVFASPRFLFFLSSVSC